jgi:hypothetical protein
MLPRFVSKTTDSGAGILYVGEKNKVESGVVSLREVRMLRAEALTSYTTTSTSKKCTIFLGSIKSRRHIVSLNRTGFLRAQESLKSLSSMA